MSSQTSKLNKLGKCALALTLSFALIVGFVPGSGLPSLAEAEEGSSGASTVDASKDTITVTKNPKSGSFATGNPVRLYVNASSAMDLLLNYQWYRRAAGTTAWESVSTSGKTVGNSAILQDYTSLAAGTYEYYCVVSNGSKEAISNTATAKVLDKKTAIGGKPDKSLNTGTTIPTSLTKGDFEYGTKADLTATGNFESYGINMAGATPWNTTHYFPDTTKAAVDKPDPKYGKVIEVSFDSYGLSTEGHGLSVCELACEQASSIYQEVAATPGSVYEWSLDFGTRKSSCTDPYKQRVAVIIGPAISSPYFDASYSAYNTKCDNYDLLYPYGYNDHSYFNAIYNKAVSEGLFKDAKQHKEAVSVEYNGGTYYIYSINGGEQGALGTWGNYSGTYTVPENQGVTVFSFVSIVSESAALGNLFDNIKFAQSPAIAASSSVDAQGNGILTVNNASASYNYGILEMRGSTAIPVSRYNVKGGSATSNGWYQPSGNAISFTDLTPGKTYRIVGVPKSAIGGVQNANLSPALVLDPECYKEFSVASVAGAGTTIQVRADAASADNGTLMIEPARTDVEYAVLKTDGSVVKEWTSSSTGSIKFKGLQAAVSGNPVKYKVVARPVGYSEINYASVCNSDVAVEITMPAVGFRDVVATDIIARADKDDALITVKNNSSIKQEFTIYNEETRTHAARGWVELQPGGETTFVGTGQPNLVYHVLTRISASSLPGLGCYSYPAPSEKLAIDYVNETIRNADTGVVSAGLRYKLQGDNSNKYYFGDKDSWVSGTGGASVSIADALTAMKAAEETAATFTYSMVPTTSEAATTVETSVKVSPRPNAPECGTLSDHEGKYWWIDWGAEKLVAGSKALQVRVKGAQIWSNVAANSVYSLVNFRWTGASSVDIEVRLAPIEGESFASDVETHTLVTRPAGPADAKGLKVEHEAPEKDENTITNLKEGMEYREYKPSGAESSWILVDKKNGNISDATGGYCVANVEDGTYEIRYAAYFGGEDVPASYVVTTATTLAVLSVDAKTAQFEPVDWGYDKAETTLTISNAGDSKDGARNAYVSDISIDKVGGKDVFSTTSSNKFSVFCLNNSEGEKNSVDLNVESVTGLKPDVYKASARVKYQLRDDKTGVAVENSKEYYAVVELSLTVNKAAQLDAPTLDVVDQAATTLDVQGGLPAGCSSANRQIEFSLDGGANWTSPISMSGSTVEYGADRLTPATGYSIRARFAGNEYYYQSPETDPLLAYTAYAAPDASIIYINHIAETATIDTDADRYEMRSGANGSGDIIVLGGSITAVADSASRTMSVQRKAGVGVGGAVIPASAWTDKSLNERPNAPSPTSTNASSSRISDGTITVANAISLQYRKTGAPTWTTINGNMVDAVAAGEYDVRYAPSQGVFASKPARVAVQIKTDGTVWLTFKVYDDSTDTYKIYDDVSLQMNVGVTSAPTKGAPSRTGYTFGGWHKWLETDEDGNVKLETTPYSFGSKLSSDVVLYATWVANEYSFKYNPMHGYVNGSSDVFTITNGNNEENNEYTVSFEAPSVRTPNEDGKEAVYPGHTISAGAGEGHLGWYLRSGGTNIVPSLSNVEFDFSKSLKQNYAAAGLTPPDNGVVWLFAKWVENDYKVVFDLGRAQGLNSSSANPVTQDVKFTEKADKVDKPTWTYRYFSDWQIATGTEDNGKYKLSGESYDFSKSVQENLSAAGFDMLGNDSSKPSVPNNDGEVRLVATWTVESIKASVPSKVVMVASYDENGKREIASVDYEIRSKTKAPLQVTSINTKAVDAFGDVFPNGVGDGEFKLELTGKGSAGSASTITLLDKNGANNANGQTYSLDGSELKNFYVLKSSDGNETKTLPLSLKLSVPESISVAYLKPLLQEAKTIAKIEYTIAVPQDHVEANNLEN